MKQIIEYTGKRITVPAIVCEPDEHRQGRIDVEEMGGEITYMDSDSIHATIVCRGNDIEELEKKGWGFYEEEK